MPEQPSAPRTVPSDVIARLTELLDGFENADDPLAPEAQRAERAFDVEVDRLFVEFVLSQDLRLSLSEFRGIWFGAANKGWRPRWRRGRRGGSERCEPGRFPSPNGHCAKGASRASNLSSCCR